MAELGIPNIPVGSYTVYVANWLQALRDDKGFLFRVAADAGKAAEIVMATEV